MSPGDLFDIIATHCERQMRRQVGRSEEVVSFLIEVIRMVGSQVIFPMIRLLVVVTIDPIDVVVRLNLVHQARL